MDAQGMIKNLQQARQELLTSKDTVRFCDDYADDWIEEEIIDDLSKLLKAYNDLTDQLEFLIDDLEESIWKSQEKESGQDDKEAEEEDDN
jgi:hypothetical protein